MDVRFLTDRNSYRKMSTEELCGLYLIDKLFPVDDIYMVYCDVDRSITGSAVPATKSLLLQSTKKEMSAEYFTERREIGIINIGASGKIVTENDEYILEHRDALYIGRGTKHIEFISSDPNKPAQFYFVSYPAHTSFPTKQVKHKESTPAMLGSAEQANKRVINKYIHPGTMETCQLVMGLTELAEGSVWNTMPAHTHQRRSEVYMYFDLSPESIVVHLMGEADATRHLIIRDRQAVLSSSWSLHAGCGTKNYSFIWAMGGENQVFDDMDWISMQSLK